LLLIAVFTAGERSQPQSTSLSSWYRIELIRSTVRSACAYSWLLELPDGSDRGEILYRSGAEMLTDCAGEGVEVDGGGPAGGGSCQVRFSVITHRPCPLVTFTASPTPTAFAVGDRYATFDSPPMLTRQRPALLGSVSTCPWYWRWSVRSCCCPVVCWARAPALLGGAFRVDTSRTMTSPVPSAVESHPLSAGVAEGQGPGGHLPRTGHPGAGGGHLGHVPGFQVRVGCDDHLGLLHECGPLGQGGGGQVVGLRLGGHRVGFDAFVVVVP